MANRIFWLHIKKSAGTSMRRALGELYVPTERFQMPSCFMQCPRDEWDDVLNTYTTPLGGYQFHRSEFARRFLYPDSWDDLFRVAFSRHPVDRVISMYYHLVWPRKMTQRQRVASYMRLISRDARCLISHKRRFDVFLAMLERQESCRGWSIFEPYGLLFSTHTNPMSNDIKGIDGRANIPNIYRLENMQNGIAACYKAAGIPEKTPVQLPHLNKSAQADLVLSKVQKRRVERLYHEDFEIYESAW